MDMNNNNNNNDNGRKKRPVKHRKTKGGQPPRKAHASKGRKEEEVDELWEAVNTISVSMPTMAELRSAGVRFSELVHNPPTLEQWLSDREAGCPTPDICIGSLYRIAGWLVGTTVSISA